MDAPSALIPVLPRLFRGLDALGGMPRTTARLAVEAGATTRSSIVDLGCGKGAAAVELAARAGCRVLGIDACPVFVESARDLARRRGVGDRCVFRIADIRGRLPGSFDGVMVLGVMPLEEAARMARARARPGGWYLIDDVVRVRGRRLPPGVMVMSREEARARLSADGDEIIAEFLPTPGRVRAMNHRLYRVIAANARALVAERPRLRSALAEYLRRQRAAARQLGGPIRPAIWVVRRCGQ